MSEQPKSQAGSQEGEGRVIRLASIVSIDVSGFSTLSEKDQRRAAENVERLRGRIEALTARHQGRIFNTAGDGFMLEFASAGAALECINELLDKRPKKEPSIRVGAHVGDVVVTVNNDLLGHGVNVAARLQSLAPPNTALVSGEFRSMARNSPSAAFKPKGRQPLDNIDERVATFAIISQKQRFRRALTGGLITAGVVAALAAVGVFAGPHILREVDRMDLFAREGEAVATTPAPAPSAPAAAVAPPVAAPVAPPPVDRRPGSVFSDCRDCPTMMALPGGVFMMGASASERGRARNEAPQRDVAIEPFALGLYEVTFAEWDACVAGGGCGGFSPSDDGKGRGKRPVTGVSWADAQGYVQWLNRQAGAMVYRLPTEAEWEFAARAGATTAYAGADKLTAQQARFAAVDASPVGSFPANAFGLFDMHGNAAEWVQDCFVPLASPDAACAARAVRGGGFSDPVEKLRAAARDNAAPTTREAKIGFRVARALD